MIELPLFPLNTVLFPGMPLPLHIFEDRYHQMINLCLKEQRPFGVVLIREGVAEMGPLARPHDIGCTAPITQVQKVDEERLFIMTVGHERFRITSLNYDRPYLMGVVEPAPLVDEPAEILEQETQGLYPLVIDYLNILAEVGSVEFEPEQLSPDTDSLGYLAASFLQIPVEEKQQLLEMDRGSRLMRNLRRLYRREVSLMQTMPRYDEGVFSLN